jgi:hypothetical protein
MLVRWLGRDERIRLRRSDDQPVDDLGGDHPGYRNPGAGLCADAVGAALYIDCHSKA